MKLIPINNQKTEVNKSFLMLNRIAINTKILTPTNTQKKTSKLYDREQARKFCKEEIKKIKN